jgi:hypothetical protein
MRAWTVREETPERESTGAVQRELEKLAARIVELEETHAARFLALEAALKMLGVSSVVPEAAEAAAAAVNKPTPKVKAPLTEIAETTHASVRRTSRRRSAIAFVAGMFDGSDSPQTISFEESVWDMTFFLASNGVDAVSIWGLLVVSLNIFVQD